MKDITHHAQDPAVLDLLTAQPAHGMRRTLLLRIPWELEPLWQRAYRVQEKSHQESTKHERYCREQRDLLRALEELAASERMMHELDNRKGQIMTICTVALTNLMMWIRDRFFPSTYAHATWQRLQPFFRLPGRVQWGRRWSRWKSDLSITVNSTVTWSQSANG